MFTGTNRMTEPSEYVCVFGRNYYLFTSWQNVSLSSNLGRRRCLVMITIGNCMWT